MTFKQNLEQHNSYKTWRCVLDRKLLSNEVITVPSCGRHSH